MTRRCLTLLCIVFLLFSIQSCSEDETTFVPLNVEAVDDASEVFQNTFIDIDILTNDSNLSEEGSLVVTSPLNASIEVLSNGTADNVLDDKIRYQPNGYFVGLDTFEYTICASPENCDSATITINVLPVTPVNFDLDAMPYSSLADYNFFKSDIANLDPVYGVLPYDLNTPLFSDYAKKKRFIWMPNNVKANYVNDHSIIDFPIGTILIKNFYYDNVLPSGNQRILETRLQIKKESGWVFANYKWNEEQTLAEFDLNGSTEFIEFEYNGQIKTVNYSLPAEPQCLTCHKSEADVPFPIGMKPQNLNKLYGYDAGNMNQLEKWVEFGYLNENNIPSEIISTVNYLDESQPLDLRVRSYLDINCAHCHSETGHCNYIPVRFSFKETGEDIANAGVCLDVIQVFDPGLTEIVKPGNAERSVLAFRINTSEPSLRMPLLGRTLKHEEGVNLIEEWIESLTTTCE